MEGLNSKLFILQSGRTNEEGLQAKNNLGDENGKNILCFFFSNKN